MLEQATQKRLDDLRCVVECCQDTFVAVLILRAQNMQVAVAAASILAQEGWTREGPFVPDGKGYLYATFNGIPFAEESEEVAVEQPAT